MLNTSSNAFFRNELASKSKGQGVVPAFDYLEGLKSQRNEILEAIARVLDSGTLILGPEVTAFENEFAQYVGSQHAIGVSSGTDALIIALRALDIGPGHEVITVANGPVPTIAAIRAVGAMPRFVDVDPISLQMNPSRVVQAITPATRCVIPLHLYGGPAPLLLLAEICRAYSLALIEDCAQAHGTLFAGRHVGTFGDIGCFSFYPTKNLGAFGDAGMCVTNDSKLAALLREQGCYGFRKDRVAHSEGLNCRLDEIQAACLRVRLKHLPTALKRRQEIAKTYFEQLTFMRFKLPLQTQLGTPSWHQFVVRVTQRDAWIGWLSKQQIHVGIHYEKPVHLMPAYRSMSDGPGSLPATEQACNEVISLPMFPELTSTDLQRVCISLRLGIRLGLT